MERNPLQGRLALTPLKAYIAHSWRGLTHERQSQVLKLVDRVELLCRDHNISTFISFKQYPPGERRGTSAHDLWIQLRKEMATCHLFVLLYEGISEGVTKELRNARDYLVPVVMLSRNGLRPGELAWGPSLKPLSQIPYRTHDQALESLSVLLTERKADIEKYAYQLELLRASHCHCRIGDTIRFLREKQGWKRKYLAERAGITEEEIEAMETDFLSLNPTAVHIVAVARALGTDLSHLAWSPEEWGLRRFDVLVTKVAMEEDWAVELVNEFRKSGHLETRPSLDFELPEEEVRREMRLWLQRRLQ
ncbi:MAG: XRE family transcriptional regulator [Chloroflexota bacterium]|nr:MAG: XRE family transcriptional regulator [Chloroflexota bacterium]